MKRILLFDGECNFCDQSVQFIIKRDKKALYSFASLQSEVGQQLIKTYHVPVHLDSLILIENDSYYVMSAAALRICRHLSGGWKLASLFWLIPRPLRDVLYKIIAKNRYKWFGKKKACILPTPEIKERFLSLKNCD